jgi:repressor LexA
VLQVKGNSMVDDHILNGDFIVVEQTQVANRARSWWRWWAGTRPRSSAFIANRAGRVRLQPANSEMQPIVVPASDVKIQGRVIGVLRKY